MKGCNKKRMLAVTAVLLLAFCTFSTAEQDESEGFAWSVSIDSLSLHIDNGYGEWAVVASGWSEPQEITYTVFQDREELYSITDTVEPDTEYRFGNKSLPIWRGAEYSIKVSADEYNYDIESYTTISDIIILGSPSMEVDEENILNLVKTPSDASCKTFLWYSSDPSIATVKDNVVSATATGTVRVWAVCSEDASISTAEFSISIIDSSKTSGYRIEVTSTEGGTAYADKMRAHPGEWVELTKTADYGYEFIDWETNTPITIIDDYAAFKMPEYTVKIKAIFRCTYPIDMAVRETENGTVLIPLNLLESKGMRDDENLKATISIVKDVPKNIPESAIAFTVSISYNDVEFTNFGNTITIILDYDKTAASDPMVYSVSNEGHEVYKIDSEYNRYTETVSFQTGKLTLFAVSDVPIEPIIVVDSSTPMYVLIIAAFIVVIAAVVLIFKR